MQKSTLLTITTCLLSATVAQSDFLAGRLDNWHQWRGPEANGTVPQGDPPEGHHPTHSYAAGSPTTDGRFLYASFGSRGIYCYDFDGNLQWQRDLGRMNTRFGWGEAVTPVIHGDALLVNWDQEAGSFLI